MATGGALLKVQLVF